MEFVMHDESEMKATPPPQRPQPESKTAVDPELAAQRSLEWHTAALSALPGPDPMEQELRMLPRGWARPRMQVQTDRNKRVVLPADAALNPSRDPTERLVNTWLIEAEHRMSECLIDHDQAFQLRPGSERWRRQREIRPARRRLNKSAAPPVEASSAPAESLAPSTSTPEQTMALESVPLDWPSA